MSRKNTEAGACYSKVFVTVSTPTALCADSQVGGVRVGGALCNKIMMEKWRQCICGTVAIRSG